MPSTLICTKAPPLEMRLVRASAGSLQPWGVSSIRDDVASIPLSLDLRSVLYDDAGHALTYLDLGRMGVSVRVAWDRAARELVAQHSSSEGVEFFVRRAPVSLAGVAGWEVADARQWMAHPSTFTVLHRHLRTLMQARGELSFVVAPGRDVAVFDCAPSVARDGVSAEYAAADVVAYSLGFPVVR